MPARTGPQTRARRAAVSRGVRALHVAVLFGVLMTVGGAAWAVWSSTGAGTGSASTGTLGEPTGVTASSQTGSSGVAVVWTAPGVAPAPTGYRVVRTSTATGAREDACGTSAATALAGTGCTDAPVPDGTYRYTVVAVRAGWTTVSADSPVVTVLAAVATSTTVQSSTNPSVVGQAVTYTATVTAGSGTPTGSVVFRDAGAAIVCEGGSQTLVGGTATCAVTHAGAGSRSVTAAYAGSAPWASSSSAVLTQSVTAAATRTVVTSSTNPSVVGQTVTYTATVSAQAPGGGTPTGTVTFRDGTTTLSCQAGSQTLVSGSATCSVSHPGSSTRSITAVYSGSPNHLTSTSAALSQVVGAATTTTSVTTSAATVGVGQTVTLTATVAATAPGGGTPSGTVSFKDGSSTIICSGGVQTLGGGGVATCTTSFLSGGTRSVTATYAGTTDYLASTSAVLTQQVTNAVGLTFTNVTVNGSAVTPVCSVGPSSTCTVTGANNSVVVAAVSFANVAGTPVSYSGSPETLTWSSTGKTSASGTVTVAANATTSSTGVTATKLGSNSATVTVTFSGPGGATWTAVITLG